jgi:hypothetical protein
MIFECVHGFPFLTCCPQARKRHHQLGKVVPSLKTRAREARPAYPLDVWYRVRRFVYSVTVTGIMNTLDVSLPNQTGRKTNEVFRLIQ